MLPIGKYVELILDLVAVITPISCHVYSLRALWNTYATLHYSIIPVVIVIMSLVLLLFISFFKMQLIETTFAFFKFNLIFIYTQNKTIDNSKNDERFVLFALPLKKTRLLPVKCPVKYSISSGVAWHFKEFKVLTSTWRRAKNIQTNALSILREGGQAPQSSAR